MTTNFLIYPNVDEEDFSFPPEVNQAIADSPEVSSTYAKQWKANTAYLSGQLVVTPDGDVVTAIANFTSGSTFNPINWAYVRMSDYFVNVKAFGAKGDGTTNDTVAIHAARDYAFTKGLPVYFPTSTYRANALIANKAGQTWIISPGATIKPTDASTASVITVDAAKVKLTGGGTLDGSTTTSVNCAGIYSFASASTDLIIEDLTIKNIAGYGIQTHSSRTIIRNNRLSVIAGLGISIAAATVDTVDCQIINNYVDRSAASLTSLNGNIHIAGTSGGLKVHRTKVHDNTVIMPLSPTSVGGNIVGIESHRNSVGTTVTGNHIVNGNMGVSIAAGSVGAIVEGNYIFSPNWYGIELAESSYCVAKGNTIDGNGILGGGTGSSTYGIVINISGSSSNHNLVSGNTIKGIVPGATNSSAGIAIAGGQGVGNVISDNVMSVSMHGISTVSENVVITGNRITGAGNTVGYAVRFTGILGKAVIADNLFENFLTGVDVTRVGGVVDNIAVSGNTFVNVATPRSLALTGGATIGPNVRWTGNVGSGVANTANGSGDLGGRFISNYYYGPQAGTLGTAAPPLNILHAYPLPVDSAAGLTVQQIAVGVSVAAAGGTVRVGVYTDANGIPGTLIEEFTSATQLDSSTTGDKTLAVALRVLPTGMYWVAAVTQGLSATVGVLTGAGPYIGRTAASSSTGHAMAYTKNGVTGALPTTFGTPDGTNYAITALLRAA